MGLADHYQMAGSFGRSLQAYCASAGKDMGQLSSQLGIDPHALQDPNARISLRKFSLLMNEIAKSLDDDVFGLKFANFFKLGDSGPFGFGLMNAPNFKAALNFYCKYISLTADYNQFTVDVGRQAVSITWNYPPFITDTSHYSDMMAALSVRQFRISGGPKWKPSSVSLMRRRPQRVELHRSIMGANLTFSARQNEIIFNSRDLALVNPHSDIRLFELMEKACDDAFSCRRIGVPIDRAVQVEIAKRLQSKNSNLSEVAKSLSLGERNLQRLLKAKGTSFEIEADRVRQELADTLLKHTELSVLEIADRVGYLSVAAFSRASQKWNSSSPTSIRKSFFAEASSGAVINPRH